MARAGLSGAVISASVNSQLQASVKNLTARVSNIERKIGPNQVPNLSSGFIPSFALRESHKKIKNLDDNYRNTGFIESLTKESISSSAGSHTSCLEPSHSGFFFNN